METSEDLPQMPIAIKLSDDQVNDFSGKVAREYQTLRDRLGEIKVERLQTRLDQSSFKEPHEEPSSFDNNQAWEQSVMLRPDQQHDPMLLMTPSQQQVTYMTRLNQEQSPLNDTFRYDENDFILSTHEANMRLKSNRPSKAAVQQRYKSRFEQLHSQRGGVKDNEEAKEATYIEERLITSQTETEEYIREGSSKRERRPDSQRARLIQAKKIEKQLQIQASNEKKTSLLQVKYNNNLEGAKGLFEQLSKGNSVFGTSFKGSQLDDHSNFEDNSQLAEPAQSRDNSMIGKSPIKLDKTVQGLTRAQLTQLNSPIPATARIETQQALPSSRALSAQRKANVVNTSVNLSAKKSLYSSNGEEVQPKNLPCSKFFENDDNFETFENQKEQQEGAQQKNIINEISPAEINLNKYKVDVPSHAKIKEIFTRPQSSGLKLDLSAAIKLQQDVATPSSSRFITSAKLLFISTFFKYIQEAPTLQSTLIASLC